MPWIDSHCHLDATEFMGGAPQVVARARAAGVNGIVVPAVEVANFDAVRTLAHTHDLVYALGIHPLYTDRAQDADLDGVEAALARHRNDPRLVAVGEIGIDHFVPGLERERQASFYARQLGLARRFDLPVILHGRRSADTLLKHLRRLPVSGGIAHAFNGSLQQAQTFIDLGFKLGFGGAMTFERALHLRRLAQTLPLDAIVLETDAPDIPPQWLYRTAADRAERGAGEPNEPAQLPRIAQTLAELRGVPEGVIAAATSANVLQALPKLAALRAADASAAPHAHMR
jgi:TatD DNase family protein